MLRDVANMSTTTLIKMIKKIHKPERLDDCCEEEEGKYIWVKTLT
jgi:hypothetical protein